MFQCCTTTQKEAGQNSEQRSGAGMMMVDKEEENRWQVPYIWYGKYFELRFRHVCGECNMNAARQDCIILSIISQMDSALCNDATRAPSMQLYKWVRSTSECEYGGEVEPKARLWCLVDTMHVEWSVNRRDVVSGDALESMIQVRNTVIGAASPWVALMHVSPCHSYYRCIYDWKCCIYDRKFSKCYANKLN